VQSLLLTCDHQGELRFWEITWEGCQVELAEGVAGTDGDAEQRAFASPSEAREFVEEQVARRRAEGYHEPAAPTPPPRTDDPELEALIARDPGDEEPYLVYADWLQARGDPRGELIAIQHALAHGGGEEARTTEARLLAEHPRHLLGDLGAAPELAELRWRLGFVEHAALFVGDPGSSYLDPQTLLRSFLAHASARFLRELVLVPRGEEEQLTAGLAAASRPSLTRLQLGAPSRPGDWLLDDALLGCCPRLVELDCFAHRARLAAAGHPGLRRLLLGAPLGRELLGALAAWQLPALEALELEHRGWDAGSLDGESLTALLAGDALPRLAELAVRCPRSDVDGAVVTALLRSGRLGRLRTLTLTLPAGEGLARLEEAHRQLAGVQLLLGGDGLSDAGLARLSQAGLRVRRDASADHAAYRLHAADSDEDQDGEDGEGGEGEDEWDEVEPQISDYDLGLPLEEEPEEEGEEEQERREDDGLGVDRDWEAPKEDPFDVDEG